MLTERETVSGKLRGYNMDKIGKTIVGIFLLMVFVGIVVLFIPSLKESMYILCFAIWSVFREFFLQDIVKKYVMYIGPFLIVCIVFGCVSKTTENKLWNLVSLICAIVEIVMFKVT